MRTRRLWTTLVVLSLLTVGPASAQSQKEHENLGHKASKLWKKTKKAVVEAGQDIGDTFGTGAHGGTTDVVRIDGVYYMPIYNRNLYSGKDAEAMRARCKEIFSEKYPQAKVVSVALPQTDWLTVPVKKKNKVTGYMRSMFCYIVARDGSDGYINAKFSYRQSKKAGGTYKALDGYAPAWERTDVLTSDIYQQLLKK